MNRDDVIRWAREAGMRDYCDSWTVEDDPTRKQPKQIHTNDLASFAALVAATAKAEEREACAKVCEELLSMVSTGDEHMDGVLDCLAAIRARGQA